MKEISFSLWGNNQKYLIGVSRNVKMARVLSRFYMFYLYP